MTSKADPPRPDGRRKRKPRALHKSEPAKTARARTRNRERLVDTSGPEPNVPPETVVFTVGVVVGSHGREGTMKVRVLSDDPEHLLTIGEFRLGDEPVPRSVTQSRLHAGQLLLALDGIATPEDVSAAVGKTLHLPAADLRPLEANEFFIYQLLGLSVETESGQTLGTVTDLIETGANDVLVVSPDGGKEDILLPMIPAVILDVDPAGGRIIARRLEYYGDA